MLHYSGKHDGFLSCWPKTSSRAFKIWKKIFLLYFPLYFIYLNFIFPVISLILFPFNAINSWHSPWKLSRAIYNIYGITQCFYWNIESPQRTALNPQTGKWFSYVTLSSWWQAFTNSPFTNKVIKLKIAAQQTELMGTKAGPMGCSLLYYRSLGTRQDTALGAAHPSPPSLFKDGALNPSSELDGWEKGWVWVVAGCHAGGIPKTCKETRFLVGPTLLTRTAREPPWVRIP